ncbi:hypothetical protein MESS2_160019 [Mesorhizobium metallidurans STM 2683]|uniref:Uncharacterized protein n=1 Tax=Mesorhizobium metallidurans STM 2683 TaxID=1297569 RepID=M5F1A7_9HYPH|nr:hypothetical protein MESS2_160019 [Mesorhizobium metallidurans STM 2683]
MAISERQASCLNMSLAQNRCTTSGLAVAKLLGDMLRRLEHVFIPNRCTLLGDMPGITRQRAMGARCRWSNTR